MKIIRHQSQFTEGIRLIMLKGRHKDGCDKQRTIIRISHDAGEFERHLEELSSLSEPDERIYASAGPRSLSKATRIFRERQLAAEYDADPEEFYRQIHNRWASALSSPRAELEKFWLLDCDTELEKDMALMGLKDHYDRDFPIYIYGTKNGYHMVVKPFNRSKLSDSVNKLIHTNAILLWGY